MTSVCKIDTPGTPLLCPGGLEIPVNSVVQVIVKDGGHQYLGVCLEDPSNSRRPDTLILHNVQGTDPNDREGRRYQWQIREFKVHELAKCDIMDKVELSEKKDDRSERLMVTQIVSKIEDVKSIIESIRNMNIKVIVTAGLIEGNAGRFGTMGWLCFVIRGLFVCIDVLALREHKEFWKLIGNEIFRNEDITKVCHNGRRLIDYLFNQHAIKIHNLYDTQLGDMYIRCHQNRDKMPANVEDIKKGSPYNWEYHKVSKIYKTFVPELILPEELAHLERNEGKIFEKDCPYLQRPTPSDCPFHKSFALELKYLEDVYNAQMKTLLSHVTHVMREQTKLIYRANSSVTIERHYIPHNVMEMMIQGSPYLSSDRSEDYAF